jgi:hypothetical protein
MRNLLRFVLVLTALIILLSNSRNLFSQNYSGDDSLRIAEKVYLHIDRDSYYPNDDIWFKAYLIDANDRSLSSHSSNLHVELISPDSKIIDSRTIRLNGGLGKGDFRLPETLLSGQYRLRAYTNYMRNFNDQLFFNKNITIINPTDAAKMFSDSIDYIKNKLEINFFPEGGSLVDGVTSIVAFKAVNALGAGCDVLGEIYSSSGEKITTFKSTHKGMGTFSITPISGLNYYALAKNLNNNEVRIEIPKSFPEGAVMSVSPKQPNKLEVMVRTNIGTLHQILDHDLLLTLSARSMVFKTVSFRMKSLNSYLILPTDDLPDGIIILTLSGLNNMPLCERLVYIQNNEDTKVLLETNKTVYSKRDSVSVKINLSESSDIRCTAFLSLSATGKEFVKTSSPFPSTISSWFLLESDVRGPVEEPSYYFDASNPNRSADLDLLLLTQGWRDFEWKYKTTGYLPEHGFIISGRARKKFADIPLRNSTVTLAIFNGGKPLIELLPIDTVGRFISEGIDITGEGKLVASVTDDKDNLKGWLLLDSTRYSPAPIRNIAHRKTFMQNDNQIGSDSMLTSEDSLITKRYHKFIQYAEISSSIKKKYKLSDTIALGEVKIIAKRVDWTETAKSRSRHYLRGEPDREIVITPQLEIYNNVYQLLTQSMILNSGPILSPRRLSRPLYLIDGNRSTEFDVRSLPISLVERIDIINDPASFAGLMTLVPVETVDSLGRFSSTMVYADGAISIILKDINDPYFSKTVFHSVTTKFSGYNEPRKFYSPRHHTTLEKDYKPDLRTTLFWEPDIKVETNMDLFLNYCNADITTSVKIIVEGITSTGIPVTSTTEYEVQ